ncbi:rhodanese-like domain-containing protein [Thiomicrorhabdus sp. 6S2-11]|jgi:rhodanese-related sulfurtransferase|uniref:Rhodanese-like domain-containing protein n=1 Tax=Thiomicrorhabdus marina TaxID=2818442 RepID=A0ABS3Q4K5_9GAMM|nr:rhodanese-like domain-containing protein [Thiomicrorhabdus marina]MBO1927269.1 rhodanese-like domain-containing protein [Thiomicrorhabdus marina]
MFSEFVQEQYLLFIALIVVIAMLVYSYVGDKLAGFKTIGADEAIRLYNDDAFVLDVRSSGEYRDGYIGNATNISVGDLAGKVNQLPQDKDAPILVYCLSGGRSSRAAMTLVKNGYTAVNNLRGGITAWKAAGLPVGKERSKKNKKKQSS